MLNRKYQCNGFMTNWAKWGCGKGRIGQCQTSRTESGLRFYTAKQERIRPISRIGRIGGAVGRVRQCRTGRTEIAGAKMSMISLP